MQNIDFLEAATKNKKYLREWIKEAEKRPKNEDRTERAIKNEFFALICLAVINKENVINEFKSFFGSTTGKIKRQGIAEQIGRLKFYGLVTDKELIKLVRACIKQYNNGESVKDIEKQLRELRPKTRTGKPEKITAAGRASQDPAQLHQYNKAGRGDNMDAQELNELLREAEEAYNSIGAKFDRLKELDEQGQQGGEEYADICLSMLED